MEKYVLKKQDGARDVANWIWKIADLSIRTLSFVLSGLDPVLRHDSALLVVSLPSAVISQQLNMLEAFFFRLHSAKYRKENKGKKTSNSKI